MSTASEKTSPRVDRSSADNARDKSPLSRTSPLADAGDPPPGRTIWDRLPPWVSSNIRSPKSRKMLLRCWIGSWVAYIIMLPNKSLPVLGNAAFFALLTSFLVPANMPVQLFLFALTTMVTGMCLGWAFGAAAMKGALAARNQLVLRETLQREQQSVAGLANPDALFRNDIFEGKFLDTRSTVVFGVFLGVANFIFALIRAYAPKLLLMSIFGTIAIDIFCSYGPLFPFAQYTLLNSLLTSTACYIAAGLVIITFVFPETVNHATLASSTDLLGKIQALVDIQQQVLESTPDDLARGAPLFNKMTGARVGIIMQMQQLIGSLKFINVEFSWGKWNGDDVKALQEPLMAVMSRSAALQSFAKVVGHPWTREAKDVPSPPYSSSVSLASNDSKASGVGDTHLLRQLRKRNHAAEAEHAVRITDIMPLIEDATAELRSACSAGLGSVKAVLENVNMRRYNWMKKTQYREEADSLLVELDEAINRLRSTLHEFSEHRRLMLLEPFKSVIADTSTTTVMPLRSLYIAYVFAANLIVLSEAVMAFMELVQTTAAKRTRSRLWAPGGLRALVAAMRTRGDVSDQAAGEDTVPQPEDETQEEERTYKMDPDSRPPTNRLQRVANSVHKLFKWTKTAQALFCFKYVIVSIALWIPAVCSRSAHFIYVEKGLWALIMAQTTLNIYASDQIFNYVVRILGTFFGALLGLLAWYIGDAKSNGSPYGSAASVAVFLVPVLFMRLFAPPQFLPGVMLFAVTFALVVGYSWIDGNLPVVGDPGIGWTIGWKRFVQVMIGCAASFVLMMLPPKSGRKAVRLRNAGSIVTLSFLYADIVSSWISSEDRVSHEKHSGYLIEWIPGFRDRLLGLAAQLQAVRIQTAFAKWEGNVRGRWPGEEYARLADVQTEMTSSLALLGSALSQIDADMRRSFLQHTRVVNPSFIADVMGTFSIVSQALKTGEPIPEAFHQNLFDRLHYHGSVGQHSFFPHGDVPHDTVHRQHAESVGRYEYMFYCTAVCAVFQLLDGLNELRSITISLCGEIPLRGFGRWKDEFDRAHLIPQP